MKIVQTRTKDHNDDDILIHALSDEIEDNANKQDQGSNVSGARDHDPLSSYSSKIKSDDVEYSSDDDERSKGRCQDLLDSEQEEMRVCGGLWKDMAKGKIKRSLIHRV